MKEFGAPGVLAIALAVATLTLAAGACGKGSATSGDGGQNPGQGNLGSLEMDLTLPGGEILTSVSWTITQGTTAVLAGTYPIPSTATTVSFLIPNVPAGSGYAAELTGTSADGSMTCIGTSVPFSVAAETTTDVSVFLSCNATGGSLDAGGVLVNGALVNCATWTSALATPAATTAGGVIALVAGAVAPDPADLTYAWSASAGAIDAPNAATANFTCPAAPLTATITLTVGDGVVPAGAECPASTSSTSLTVECGGVVDAGADSD